MKAHRRTFGATGFSLIELLVVVAILGLLAVAVLPNLSNTSKTERVREGTGKLSSFVALAQSRALGASTPRGIVLRQLSNSATAYHGGPAIDLATCESPEPYSGETYESRVLVFIPSFIPFPGSPFQYYTRDWNGNGVVDVYNEQASGIDRNRNGVLESAETGHPQSFPNPPYANLEFGPSLGDFSTSAVRDGDLISFGGGETWFRLGSSGSPSLTSFIAEIRPEMGQTLSTTPWPEGAEAYGYPGSWGSLSPSDFLASHTPLRYTILPQPRASTAVSEQLSGEAAVDMAWASVGYELLRSDDPATPIGPGVFTVQGNWFKPGLDICVLFNAVGSPSEVIQIPTTGVSSPAVFYRKQLTEPFFLLVGRADRVGQDYVAGLDPDANPDSGCNWQHPDSRWVAIDTNGRVVVAEPAPISNVPAPPPWWEALRQSQQFIRSDLGAAP